MYAAFGGKLAVVDRLLTAGADTAPRDVQDWSALDFAQVSGATEVAQHLKAHGALALQRTAITNESITSVQRARQGRDLYAGWPDLAVAAARNSPELVQSLLAHGADPNAATPDGTPVLGVAAVSGAPTTVATLLLAGAKSHGDRHGNSALLTATRDGREDVVTTMLSHGISADGTLADPEPPIVAAAKTRHYGIVRALVAAHAHVDARDAHGITALMRVTEGTDPTAVRQLLEAGAAAEGVDKAGRTALWYAARANRADNVQVLLQHGASADHADANGVTPLAAASSAGAVTAVDLLLSKGSPIEARTVHGDTALLLAASAGSTDVVERLLARHANKDAQNEFGDTALIIASRNGNSALVKQLLSSGASTRLRNKDRLTAFDVAAARSFPEITDLLKGA
jgi:uncharacterized protein